VAIKNEEKKIYGYERKEKKKFKITFLHVKKHIKNLELN